MKRTLLASLALLVLAGAASAQPYGYGPPRGYGPPPDVYEEEEVVTSPRRGPYAPIQRQRVQAFGLNCDAVQYGFSGPQPFSCPLPRRQPLGSACSCTQGGPFGPQTLLSGRAVP